MRCSTISSSLSNHKFEDYIDRMPSEALQPTKKDKMSINNNKMYREQNIMYQCPAISSTLKCNLLKMISDYTNQIDFENYKLKQIISNNKKFKKSTTDSHKKKKIMHHGEKH